MLRFLLYVLLFFVLFRLVSAVIRMMVGRPGQRNMNSKKPGNSNVNVDKDRSGSKGYKGGEYIDYEEVD